MTNNGWAGAVIVAHSYDDMDFEVCWSNVSPYQTIKINSEFCLTEDFVDSDNEDLQERITKSIQNGETDGDDELYVALIDAYSSDDAEEDFQEYLDNMSIEKQDLSMHHEDGYIVVTCKFGDIWLQLPDTAADSMHNIKRLDVPKTMLDDAINYVNSQFDDTDEVAFYTKTGYAYFTV